METEILDSIRVQFLATTDTSEHYSFLLLGASGDLATKKTYPTLWELFKKDLLPENFNIVGYARSDLNVDKIRKRVAPWMAVKDDEKIKYEEFWKINEYVRGQYNDAEVANLDKEITRLEAGKTGNRVWYWALPPSVYEMVADLLKKNAQTNKGFSRYVVEKPFGKDSESSEKLSKHLRGLFTEDQIYRIDHYLGKEMVQNLLVTRFANRIYEPMWNRHSIQAVEILFKEPFGTWGRGAYFDEYGMIRDVVQNHLLQVVCLVAMEPPESNSADDIRDAKVSVLKSMRTIVLDEVVLGQYVGNPDAEGDAKRGYLDDPTVKPGSLASTFALVTIHVDNERWKGVPFFIKAGKATNESRVEVRVQFRDVPDNIFGQEGLHRNQLIFRIQPNEAVYQQFMIKKPGMGFEQLETELDLTYSKRYKDAVLPDAYERLILDVYAGMQTNYVRTDELAEAWRVFTSVLHRIDNEKVRPILYVFGSQSLAQADALEEKFGYEVDP